MISDLTHKLMSEIGLDIDSQYKIIDQDFLNVVMFNGKFMKCSLDNREPFIGKNDVYFDPVNNTKLMMNLFSYFLEKHRTFTGMYFNSFYQIPKGDGSTCLEVKGTTSIMRSNYYFNESLKYIEIIFRLAGNDNVNLSQYDIK